MGFTFVLVSRNVVLLQGVYKALIIKASFAEVSGCYLLSFFSGHLFGAGNDVYPTKV